MPASTALANRSPAALATARTQVTLGHIAEVWRRESRGLQFVDALRTFLSSLRSDNTRVAYTTAIVEFVDWLESAHGRVPLPSEITRERAFEYATWLRTRSTDLLEYRLKQNPGRKFDYAVYRFVKERPGAHIADIRESLLRQSEFTSPGPDRERILTLEKTDPKALDPYLACMIEQRTLTRTPSIEDIRSRRVAIDPELNPADAQITYRVDPDLFAYRVPAAARKASPSTVAAKLAPLHSFWSFLIDSGENVAGGREPLLKFNIWTTPAKEAARERRSHQQVNRAKKTPDLEIFNQIIGTTYRRTAEGAATSSPDYDDVRDRAMLLFALYIGARETEIITLRRGDVTWGKEPMVDILGKRNKRRLVAIPPAAYDALLELTRKIEALASTTERTQPHRVAAARKLLETDAPLFAPIKRWGCNVGATIPRLRRSAIGKMLHRRAAIAGFAPGSPEMAKVHTHGWRHLAAQASLRSGTPVNVVQAVLGHESLSTTGTYLESRDPRDNVLFAGPPVAAAPTAAAVPVPSPVIPTAAPVKPRPRVIETTGVGVPTAKPTPPEERLIAVGEDRPLERPAEWSDEPALDAVETLQKIYETTWGEHGNRQRIKPTGTVSREAAEIYIQLYAGRVSALSWWDGPSGALDPSMPVLGPAQVEGAETPFGSAMKGLDALWGRWMTDDSKGPTAAYALLAWIRDSLNVAVQLNDEIERRHGEWLAHDAPLPLGFLATKDAERKRFRLHRDDRVVEWFEGTAWQHRISRGRTGLAGERRSQVIDKKLEVPAWYGSTDPLAELPADQRSDLFDWLLSLTGKPPRDTAPRFQGGVSRRTVAEVIGLLCEYDERLDELKEASRSGREGREAMGQLKDDVRTLEKAIRLQIAKATSQRVPDFDVSARVKERIEQTKKAVARGGQAPPAVIAMRAEEKEGSREPRRDFYLRIAGELFGKLAAEDPYLSLFALCSRGAPLAGGVYPQLFRIDTKAKTIVHEPEFAARFAQELHMHSECVARRLARELWELRQKQEASLAAGGRRERLLDRPDELIESLDAMAAYRVPCPASMEQELRGRIGQPTEPPVYEEWRRWRDERKYETPSQERERERAEAVAEEMAGAQERYREATQREFAKPNPRAREYRYTPNVARLVPSPVLLLFCLYS
jgi:integrase